MDLGAIDSNSAAFVAGLLSSLHCAGMCGPLGCMLLSGRGRTPGTGAHLTPTIYHLARLGAYGLLGAIAGGLGRAPLSWMSQSVLRWWPWTLVGLFVALAFRLDRHLPKPVAVSLWLGRLRTALSPGSVRGAAALGFATPLLPCGPLYLLVALALVSGSAAQGAELMVAFGLGTLPLLWVAQTQFRRLSGRLSPRTFDRIRTVLALLTAAALAWRLRATLGFPGPDPTALICY